MLEDLEIVKESTQRLDELRLKRNQLLKEVKDVSDLVARASTSVIDSQMDASVYRVKRGLVCMEKGEGGCIENLGAEIRNLFNIIELQKKAKSTLENLMRKLVGLKDKHTSACEEEVHLWTASHRKVSSELDATQKVHTQMAMYTARIVQERKEWQIAHDASADLGTTYGFFDRCTRLTELSRPQRLRFGDDGTQLADKYMSNLIESSKQFRIGSKDEISLLESLVQTLTTGTAPSGTVLDPSVFEQRRKFELSERDKLWAYRIADWGKTIASLNNDLSFIRSQVKGYEEAFQDFSQRIQTNISQTSKLNAYKFNTLNEDLRRSRELVYTYQQQGSRASMSAAVAGFKRAASSHRRMTPRVCFITRASYVVPAALCIVLSSGVQGLHVRQDMARSLVSSPMQNCPSRSEISRSPSFIPSPPESDATRKNKSKCEAVLSLLSASQTATRENTNYQAQQLEDLIKYQESLAEQFTQTLTQYRPSPPPPYLYK